MAKSPLGSKVNINAYRDDPILSKIFTDYETKGKNAIAKYKEDLNNYQVSKLNIGYMGNIYIDSSHSTRISHIANVSLENRTFYIAVNEPKKYLNTIIKAILQEKKLNASLGDEKNIVKVTIPDSTEERRNEVIKEMKARADEYKMQINNIRRDVISDLDKQKKNKAVSEDAHKTAKNIIDSLKDQYLAEIDILCIKQESDIRKAIK